MIQLLIDMIGLVTNVSSEKQYPKAGKVTRMIELEITDVKHVSIYNVQCLFAIIVGGWLYEFFSSYCRGEINCAFFGNYVDIAVVEVQTPRKMISRGNFSKVQIGSHESIGDYSANLSKIGPNAVLLDEISPWDGSGVSSSVPSVGSEGTFPKPAEKMRLRSVKLEKE